MEQRLQPIDYLLRRGRAACDADSDREQILQGTRQRAGRRDNSSAVGAIAKPRNNAWLTPRLICRFQVEAQVYGHPSSSTQYTTVAGRVVGRWLVVGRVWWIGQKVGTGGVSTGGIPIAVGSPAGSHAAGLTDPASIVSISSKVAGSSSARISTRARTSPLGSAGRTGWKPG